MTKIRIENPVESEFAMVPNAVWRTGLSFKAKGLFCYLLSFRHGGSPTVAQIEAETGLSRDARRKAMKELVEAGLAGVRYIRRRGQIVGQEMVVSTVPLSRPTENQADGESDRSPEKPSVGKTVPQGVENRPLRDVFSGDNQRERKNRAAANARAAIKPKAGADPEQSKDRDVRQAVDAYRDASASLREREQIANWLRAKGYALPERVQRD